MVQTEAWPATLDMILYFELFHSPLIHQKVNCFCFFFFKLHGFIIPACRKTAEMFSVRCKQSLLSYSEFLLRVSCSESLYVRLSWEVVQSPPRGLLSLIAVKRWSFICWLQRLVRATAKLCRPPPHCGLSSSLWTVLTFP